MKKFWDKVVAWAGWLLHQLLRLVKWILGPKPMSRVFKILGIGALVGLVGALLILLLVSYARDQAKDRLEALGDRVQKFARYLPERLPEQQPVQHTVWLDQNWSNEQRFWFHHTSQGTATIPVPYDWFMSLEQPELFIFERPKLLSDPEYLKQFGFIPSPDVKLTMTSDIGSEMLDCGGPIEAYGYQPSNSSKTDREKYSSKAGKVTNEDCLPVGFAKLRKQDNPNKLDDGKDKVGFTCAACHTGHIEYNGVSLRFDGGPAMLDLEKLESAVGLSIGYTQAIPLRFCRFAERLWARLKAKGELTQAELAANNGNCSSQWKRDLKSELKTHVAELKVRLAWRTDIYDSRASRDVHEGFGRLDALNRIGNEVFFEKMIPRDLHKCAVMQELDEDKEATKKACKKYAKNRRTKLASLSMPGPQLASNLVRVNAPVSFPPLWGVPWFSWAQYDASVQNELVRNAGEALGVKADFQLTLGDDSGMPLFQSSMNLKNIHAMEELLRGEHPLEGKEQRIFKGLRAPVWPTLKLPQERLAKDVATNDQPSDHWSWSLLGEEWRVDWKKVSAGRKLYRLFCFECHRGPVNDSKFDQDYPEYSFWRFKNPDREKNWIETREPNETSNENETSEESAKPRATHYFNPVQKTVKDMGTDPQQARALTQRQVHIPKELKFDILAAISQKSQRDNSGSSNGRIGNNPILALNVQKGCDLPDDPAQRSNFALALMAVVDSAIEQWFRDNKTKDEDRKKMRGIRPNCPNKEVYRTVTQTELSDVDRPRGRQYESNSSTEGLSEQLQADGQKTKLAVRIAYRARPLDGVWATAPYLHNGSVPNLDDMLKPAHERTAVFCVGDRQFDPHRVGVRLKSPKHPNDSGAAKTCPPGLTRLDTRDLGNSNSGHSFEFVRDNHRCEVGLNENNEPVVGEKGNNRPIITPETYDPKKYSPGVIGPSLCDEARSALIEYLKTL